MFTHQNIHHVYSSYTAEDEHQKGHGIFSFSEREYPLISDQLLINMGGFILNNWFVKFQSKSFQINLFYPLLRDKVNTSEQQAHWPTD